MSRGMALVNGSGLRNHMRRPKISYIQVKRDLPHRALIGRHRRALLALPRKDTEDHHLKDTINHLSADIGNSTMTNIKIHTMTHTTTHTRTHTRTDTTDNILHKGINSLSMDNLGINSPMEEDLSTDNSRPHTDNSMLDSLRTVEVPRIQEIVGTRD